MEIVQMGANVLKDQIEETHLEYDFHPYLIREGEYVYNAVTGDVAKDIDQVNDRDLLIKRWFMAPKNFDIDGLLYFNRQSKIHDTARIANEYTIFTTMRCNAACEYCFQHGGTNESMTEKMAEEVAAYILNHSDVSKRIVLRWFGGEPLMNKGPINVICRYLRDRGVNFKSNMSTNGDLFPEVGDGELYLWNLSTVQLTIDYPDEEYARIKGLPEGAYERLKETVRRFELLGVRANIRVHYHPESGLEPALKIINDFKDFGNVYMYAAMIYDEPRTQEDYNNLFILEDKMIEAGVLRFEIGGANKVTYCMADNLHSKCIRVDGSLTPCEHYYTGESSGTIFDPDEEIDHEMLKKWRSKRKYRDHCTDCPLYPTCEILTNCPSCGVCEDGYKEYRINRVKRVLKSMGGSK